MSASAIELVLARVRTALAGHTDAGARVDRGREDAHGQDELPALQVIRTDSSEEAFANNLQRTHGTFDLVHLVDIEGGSASNWETVADALHMQAHAVLAADAQLPGLCRGLRCTGTTSNGDSADRNNGRLVAHYQFQLLVRPGDLSVAIT